MLYVFIVIVLTNFKCQETLDIFSVWSYFKNCVFQTVITFKASVL